MAGEKDKKIISEYLISALSLEDRMSVDVYGAFLDRNAWPDYLDDKVFENIKKLLTVVIEDTEMHKKSFSALQEKVNNKYI